MTKEIIKSWLDGVQRDLIKNYNRLGLRASGDWEKSLEQFQELDDKTLKVGIEANDYTFYLENGRGRNVNRSEKAIKAWVGWAGSTFLDKWVKDKGIKISPYAVAYKIAREGIKVPNKYNKGGLVSDVLTEKRIAELNKALVLNIINDFRSSIIKSFK